MFYYPSLAAISYLLVGAPTSLSPDLACLANARYDAPGKYSVFLIDQPCLASLPDHVIAQQHLIQRVRVPRDQDTRLLFLERQDVDPVIDNASSRLWHGDELDVFFQRVAISNTAHKSGGIIPDNQQQVLRGAVVETPPSQPELLAIGPSHGLISIPSSLERTFDSYLPRFWRGSLLSPSPQPLTIPVPSSAISRVSDILKQVKFDPIVASLVNNISLPQMRNDIRFLTGEDSRSGILSRHSFSDGIRVAASWIKQRVEDTGAECHLTDFLPGFGPNVICKYPSTVNTTESVLLSAHYDSRGSFGSTRAPGGDDDGSGTVSVLGIARTIARRGITFRKNVELCWFAGEEQGLYGSRAYARELRGRSADLTLMIQADMLGYHANGEPPQIGLPDRIGTPEVAHLVANLSAIYSPELTVGLTSACCSDHQSFHEQGFPATQVFERAGPIADPMYHNSGDLSEREGYDFDQIKSIAKIQFATLLFAAGFDITDED